MRESTTSYVVLIPTYERPMSLKNVLESLLLQECPPTHIFVCDASMPATFALVQEVCQMSTIPTTLIMSDRPSIPHQRNLLINAVRQKKPETQKVLFLDDDTIPKLEYGSILIQVLNDAGDTCVGASGVTNRPQKSKLINFAGWIFLHSGLPGSVLPSGVNVPVNTFQKSIQKTEWIFGCSMWRFGVFNEFAFPDDWRGYAKGEDVYFSYQVSSRYSLFVAPTAILTNSSDATDVVFSYDRGLQTIENRYKLCKILRRNQFLVNISFIWSTLGSLIFAFLMFIRKPSSLRLNYLRGLSRGLVVTLMRYKKAGLPKI